MRQNEFIICGSGASLNDLTGTDCVGRHVIAVNRAILNPIVAHHAKSWVCWDSHEINQSPQMITAFAQALIKADCYLRRTELAGYYASLYPQVCLFEDAGDFNREQKHGELALSCKSIVITTAMHLAVYYGAEHIYLSGVDYETPTHGWTEGSFTAARMALLKEMTLRTHAGRISWLHDTPKWAEI